MFPRLRNSIRGECPGEVGVRGAAEWGDGAGDHEETARLGAAMEEEGLGF